MEEYKHIILSVALLVMLPIVFFLVRFVYNDIKPKSGNDAKKDAEKLLNIAQAFDDAQEDIHQMKLKSATDNARRQAELEAAKGAKLSSVDTKLAEILRKNKQ